MKTVVEILTEVKYRIASEMDVSPGVDDFSDEAMISIANQLLPKIQTKAYNEAPHLLQGLLTSDNIDFVNGTGDLPNDYFDHYLLPGYVKTDYVSIKHMGENEMMTPVDEDIKLMAIAGNTIYIYPMPIVASLTLSYTYTRVHPTLTQNSSTIWFDILDRELVDGIVQHYMQHIGEGVPKQ